MNLSLAFALLGMAGILVSIRASEQETWVFVLSGQSNAGLRGTEKEIAKTAGGDPDFSHLVTTPDADWQKRGGGLLVWRRNTDSQQWGWQPYAPNGDPAQPGPADGKSRLGHVPPGEIPLGIDPALLWRLSERLANRRIALIHTYSNATSLALTRDGKSRTFWPEAGREYRTLLIDPIRKGMNELAKNGVQPVLKGVFWMQGERDGQNGTDGVHVEQPAAMESYAANLSVLLDSLRRDTGQSNLAFVSGLVWSSPGKIHFRDEIRHQQQAFADAEPLAEAVETSDLERPDGIHMNGVGQSVLGTRMADAMLKILASPSP